MKRWHLAIKEIHRRKAAFLQGLAAVIVAAACVTGAYTALRAHEQQTDRILIQRERATNEEMRQLENDVRRIMLELGYNLLILPAEQSLTQLRADGYPESTMPEEHAYKLGRSAAKTINHLLPILQKKIVWPERDMTIILSGASGQVPVLSQPQHLLPDGTYKRPLTKPILTNEVILGAAIGRELNLKPGDTIKLMGEDFQVLRVNPPEGGPDDIIIWCDLHKVQNWLNLRDRISGILALECICRPDALHVATEDINRVLPDVQVLAFSSRLAARADMRQRAEQTAKQAIMAEREHRAAMQRQLNQAAGILGPLAAAGATLWVLFVMLTDVHKRRFEIGILRAMGMGQIQIAGIFLIKAFFMGVAGAILGYIIGVVAGSFFIQIPANFKEFYQLLDWHLALLVLGGAMLLCILAGGWPAVSAARLDPAAALRED